VIFPAVPSEDLADSLAIGYRQSDLNYWARNE